MFAYVCLYQFLWLFSVESSLWNSCSPRCVRLTEWHFIWKVTLTNLKSKPKGQCIVCIKHDQNKTSVAARSVCTQSWVIGLNNGIYIKWKQIYNLCLWKFTLSDFKKKIWTWTGTQTSRFLTWRSTIELSWFNCQFKLKSSFWNTNTTGSWTRIAQW